MIYEEKSYTRHAQAGNFKHIEYEEENSCWVCTSHARHIKGYAMIKRRGKKTTIPRYIYEDYHGVEIGSLHVRHKCDNPSCINPDHLELGTNEDNQRDKVLRGRTQFKVMLGENHHNSVLKVEQVTEIKKLLKEGNKTYSHIGAIYGVSGNAIRSIDNGKSWKDVKI